ncbi:MAG: DUF1223 domain-containing protein [Mucilaginibacter sp.]
MKTKGIFGLAGALLLSTIVFTGFTHFNKKHTLNNNASKGFAVIELFTSEGCSSCPPADELVARIEKESSDKPVYILAFHVDYWNSPGWKDVFSNADYSKRQHQYAQYLNLSSVYTPQIVVNGKKEFVGSEEGTLRGAIKAALQKEAPAELTLSDIKIESGHLTVRYQAEGTGEHTNLLLALVQKQAQSHVKGGENGGRTLSHAQIVKNLQIIALSEKNGNKTIALPSGFAPQNFELIGFLQNTHSGEIVGATKSAIPQAADQMSTGTKSAK